MHNKGNTPSIKSIEEAILNNKLYELFIGEFGKQNSPYASLPTDSEVIFNSWILFVDSMGNSLELWKRFEEIVVNISISKDLSWFSIIYLYSFLEHIKHRNSNFNINVQLFVDKIIYNIERNKEILIKDYRWIASEKYSFCLWDYLSKRVKNFSEEYEYNFT